MTVPDLDREIDRIHTELGALNAKFDSLQKTISTDFGARLAALEQWKEGLFDINSKLDSLRDSVLVQISRTSENVAVLQQWKKGHDDFAGREVKRNEDAFEGVRLESKAHETRLGEAEKELRLHRWLVTAIGAIALSLLGTIVQHLVFGKG